MLSMEERVGRCRSRCSRSSRTVVAGEDAARFQLWPPVFQVHGYPTDTHTDRRTDNRLGCATRIGEAVSLPAHTAPTCADAPFIVVTGIDVDVVEVAVFVVFCALGGEVSADLDLVL